MVIRGAIRSNGKQLAHYLLSTKENEKVEILEVDGKLHADAKSLHMALHQMDLTAELSSRTDKGLYHAVLNPAYGEDKTMTPERWQEAAYILAKNLGYENARQAIVLHTKKGRTHAHVVWERFDKEKFKMVPNDHSRIKQDNARKEIELKLHHKETPYRNKHRPELKASISQLWNQTGTGAQFVKAARENNYIIAGGSGRRPYMVVDEHGRSFDLVRQLNGVKTKEVRERLHGEKLMGEKDAIAYMQKEKARKEAVLDKEAAEHKAKLQQNVGSLKSQFASNKEKIERTSDDKEARRLAFRKEMEELNRRLEKDKDKEKDIGPEPDY